MTPELDISWDGVDYPYAPPKHPKVDPRLRFHVASDVDLDPITFEVLSSRLWNINEEHADTIQRVSGSPVVVYNNDFNTCISLESGEPFLFAPYIQYFAGAAEPVIKFTLENRSGSPGIQPGDIFVSNDPFIAGSHQMDICVYAPVFIDDALYCWVFNSCHARDVGGIEPGSFCIQSADRYSEPPAIRAMKLADAEGIRADVEDTILRFSRIPHLLALELRSQIAGIVRARLRVGEIIDQHGPDIVKKAMHKLIDDTERSVRERLVKLPDGRWSDVVYFGGATIGDREAHKIVLTLEKHGDQMTFSNRGTDGQVGSVNCGHGQFRAAIGSALAYTLAFDHRFCVGGVLRCADFDAEIGTITSVDRDGAITSTHAQLLTIYMAGTVIGKMMFSDPELRNGLMGASALATCGWITYSGTDQWGQPFAGVSLDHAAGGIGAFPFRDGVDQGGTTFWPKLEIPDCESWEHFFPLLYLYRVSAPNGGHGKYRGGNGIGFGWVGHDTDDQRASFITMASGLPVQSGVFGGHWGDTGRYFHLENTNIRAGFADGRMPASPADLRELTGTGGPLQAKALGMRFHEADVLEEQVCGGGGYGDPLERDPDRVAQDVRDGSVTRTVAEHVYGVVLGPDATPSQESTDRRRGAMRDERLAKAVMRKRWAGAVTSVAAADHRLQIAERLAIARLNDGPFVTACSACGHVLCEADENYREWSAQIDGSLVAVDPTVFSDPAEDVDVEVVYRTYVCPSCAVAFDNELTVAGEPPVWDIAVDIEALRGRELGK